MRRIKEDKGFKPLVLAALVLLALLGCRRSDELVIRLRAESELDPGTYPRLAVLDFAYGGELELGELAAERVRERLTAGGRFTVVRGMTTADPVAPLYDLAGEELETTLERAREAGADLLVTGKLIFSRRDAQDYAERLAESYDVEETRSPDMIVGRSIEADRRRASVNYTLELSLRAHDTETGEAVWRRSFTQTAESAATNRTPSRSELMGVFNSLLYPLVEELRLSLEPHLRAETRYVVP